MNKFFKLLLLFPFIITIVLFYKNHLNKARINVSDCPNNRYMANRKKYCNSCATVRKYKTGTEILHNDNQGHS